MDTATKTGINALETASKNVVHKEAEPPGEFADKIVKPRPLNAAKNSIDVEEMIIVLEKTEELLNELKKVL